MAYLVNEKFHLNLSLLLAKSGRFTWPEKFVAKGAVRVAEYEDIRKHLGSEAFREAISAERVS